MKKLLKKEIINAWGIVNIEREDIGNEIFETKKNARSYVNSICHNTTPEIKRFFLKHFAEKYRIIPIKISYSLPLSIYKNKKNGKI